MNNKKIICFIDNLGSGGSQRQLVNLSLLLKEEGYSIEFLTYGKSDFYISNLKKGNIPVIYIQSSTYLGRIFKVCRYLLKNDTDAIISFMETPCFLSCVAKSLGGKWRLITNERSAKDSTFIGLKHKIYNWFEIFSDAKVCNSYSAMRLWKLHYPQYIQKLKVIYNLVIISNECMSFNQSKRKKELHIVVAASYQQLKNSIGVIEALNLLSLRDKEAIHIDWYGRPEVTLGDTTIYDKSVKLIADYKLQFVIKLHDVSSDIYSIMSEADVVGLFSTVEGLPNAICEGMMLGKPIIMTRVSDYDVLVDGNGILCDPNPQSIAEALRTLLSLNDAEIIEMGKVSYQKAQQLFSNNIIINQWNDVLCLK